MLENINFKELFCNINRVDLILENDAEKIDEHFRNIINERRTVKIRFVTLPFYANIYSELLEKSINLMKKSIRSIRNNVLTNFNSDRQWILNYVINTKYLNETMPIEVLKDKYKGIPAIIVGAGPSLEANLEHLKKITNQAIIVGAGNGIKVLEANNIKAHIVGAMDGKLVSEKIYKNLVLNKDTTLFYSSQVFNTIPGILNGNKFLMNQVDMDVYINSNCGGASKSRFSGPSITNVLAYNMSLLGCNPIIFLGQDLCAINNVAYSKDTIYTEDNVSTPNLMIKTFNKNGEECFTSNDFLAMKDNMEIIVNSFPEIQYLNGTENGLKINGAKDIDFNNYVDKVLMLGKNYNILPKKMFLENSKFRKSSTSDFISNLYKDTKEINGILEDILEVIDSDKNNIQKENNILTRERKLLEICFYKNVLKKVFGNELELVFAEKETIIKKKNIYMYYLDKCNLIIEILKALYNLE